MTGQDRENLLPDCWVCTRCDEPLVETAVQVQYLGNAFTIIMPACPRCGMAMVTEEIATGKMAEAEQVLEDK